MIGSSYYKQRKCLFEYVYANLLNDYTFKILGGSVSNALGSIAVVYSSLYLLFGQVYEQEDEAKTCVTGAATGTYYKNLSHVRLDC